MSGIEEEQVELITSVSGQASLSPFRMASVRYYEDFGKDRCRSWRNAGNGAEGTSFEVSGRSVYRLGNMEFLLGADTS